MPLVHNSADQQLPMKDASRITGKRICVLISGRGSNLQAIHHSCIDGTLKATIALVVSNNPHATGLEFAAQNNIATSGTNQKEYSDKNSFDRKLSDAIDEYDPALIALAGFMRVLSGEFANRYRGRLVNIHPSLQPRHKGRNTHRKALASGDRWHGCSVHYVSPTLDDGPLIARSIVPVLPDDTEDSLSDRVLAKEHLLYPKIISSCLRGDFVCRGEAVQFRGKSLRYPLTF